MSMFVGIEVSWPYSSRKCFLDLRTQLDIHIHLPLQQRNQKLVRRFGQGASSYNGEALHQHEMTTHIECWRFSRKPDSIIESVTVRHQRGRGEHTFAMTMHYPSIYIPRESEIIGVNN